MKFVAHTRLPTTSTIPANDLLDTSSGLSSGARKPLGRARPRTDKRATDLFRSTSPQDKILESSVSTKPLRDTVAKLDKGSVSVQDTDTVVEEADDEEAIDGPGRLERAVAILIRRESHELLGLMAAPHPTSSWLANYLLTSAEHLHTFARLVSDDLLTVSKGDLEMTPFGLRVLETLASRTI